MSKTVMRVHARVIEILARKGECARKDLVDAYAPGTKPDKLASWLDALVDSGAVVCRRLETPGRPFVYRLRFPDAQ